MPTDINITKLVKNHIPHAAFILNEEGNVITFNEAGKKYLPIINEGSYFFKLFETDASQFIERLFLEAKNFNKMLREELSLETENIKDEFEVVISPLENEDGNEYLITIKKIDKKYTKSGIDKFTIYTSEIEELISSPDILSIIEKIKSSFPFTFIGKTKFQKEINQLEELFWIKEPNGKYIIVNQNFANSLGLKASQIEGQNEKELLPKYLVKLYNTIDSYVIETTNSVFVDRVTSPTQFEPVDITEIIEFPITDVDNKVVAIVGISRKKPEDKKAKTSEFVDNSKILKDIDKPIVIINNENKIVSYSHKLFEYLPNKDVRELEGEIYKNIFEKKFVTIIDEFINSLKNESIEYGFRIKLEKDDKEATAVLNKIFDSSDTFWGISIQFGDKILNQSQTELKGKMYDIIMQASPDAMFVYDVDNLKFLEVNEAALKLYGYNKNIFLNMDLTDLYAPEDIQTLIESSDSKKLAGTFTGPWRHKKSDGSSILVELSKTDLDYQGKRAHLNIVRDVTEQLEKNKRYQLFKATYENSTDVIVNTDQDGFITYANDSAVKLFERTKKDLEKRPFLSLVGDNDRAKINAEVFHSGEKDTQTIELELKKESGDLFNATITASPILDYMGEIESFNLIVSADIEYLPMADTKPVKSGGVIDAPFLSNVFHELLTPINVIIGFVQELQESIDKPSEDQQEAIQIINENQKMLLQLMDNAVEYSQLEQGQITLKPEDILFTDLIDDLKEGVKKTASANKVEFTYGKISSSLKFQTDKHRVVSLLTLFLKFSIQITKEKKVFLSAYLYDDEHCVISVKDKRSGITEYLSKGLTEIFTKDENQIRRNYGFSRFTVKLTQKLIQLLGIKTELISKGGNVVEYGLVFPLEYSGEYVVQKEVETILVKGEEIPIKDISPKIETVENKQEKEAKEPSEISVNITVPEKPEEKPPVKETPLPPAEPKPVVEQKPPAPPVPLPQPVNKTPVDIKVLSCLYVEDQIDSQILFKVQMKDLRSMEFAISFEEALPLIKSHRFDFIVLDINLQGEYNGLDALRVIQKMPGYEDIPIIAVTAYVLPGDREKFIAAGFTDFISKPVLRDKLLDVLNKIFG